MSLGAKVPIASLVLALEKMRKVTAVSVLEIDIVESRLPISITHQLTRTKSNRKREKKRGEQKKDELNLKVSKILELELAPTHRFNFTMTITTNYLIFNPGEDISTNILMEHKME